METLKRHLCIKVLILIRKISNYHYKAILLKRALEILIKNNSPLMLAILKIKIKKMNF